MKRILAAAALSAAALTGAPSAHADQVAYLVNVTVRPGYNFPNADASELRQSLQRVGKDLK